MTSQNNLSSTTAGITQTHGQGRFQTVGLPGFYDTLTSQVDLDSAFKTTTCGFDSSFYQGLVSTTLDSRPGVSGSPVYHFQPLLFNNGKKNLDDGRLWALANSSRRVSQNDTWGFNTPSDGNYPANFSTAAELDSNIVAHIADKNAGKPDDLMRIRPARYLTDLDVTNEPAENEIPGSCYPNCEERPDDKNLVTLKCGETFAQTNSEWKNLADGSIDPEYQYFGSAIGLAGIPFYTNLINNQIRGDEITALGNLGLVCSPWSSWPYSEFWQYVQLVIKGTDTKWVSVWDHFYTTLSRFTPFSVTLNKNSIKKRFVKPEEEGGDDFIFVREEFPFQNCPPGYVLNGFEFLTFKDDFTQEIKRNVIAGVTKIKCDKIYPYINGPSSVSIPLRPAYYNDSPNNLKHETQIGENTFNSDYHNSPILMECDPGLHVSGIQYEAKNPDNPGSFVSLLCSSNPTPLPKDDDTYDTCQVNYVIPSGSVKASLGVDHSPSCLVGTGSTWGTPGPCPMPNNAVLTWDF